MAPTTDYQILEDTTKEGLQTQVKAAIAQGWQVYPGPFFAGHQLPYRRNEHFYQPMVKTTNLLEQINNKLATIITNTGNTASNTSTIASNTGKIVTNTAEIATNTRPET